MNVLPPMPLLRSELAALAAIVAINALCGCGGAMKTKLRVVVISNPPGAGVWRENVQIGTTPLSMAMTRDSAGGEIIIRKIGYMPATCLVRPDTAPAPLHAAIFASPEVNEIVRNLFPEYALDHEQRHFDIAEFFARNLRDTLHHRTVAVAAIEGQLLSRAISHNPLLVSAEERYDRECGRGYDVAKQLQRDAAINRQLKNSDSLLEFAVPLAK